MGKGNFRVKCLNRNGNTYYTEGKTYEIKNGTLIADDGDEMFVGMLNTFDDLQRLSGAKWELVSESTNKQILIFTRKNRVVATITKGEQKFTQSVSLHKTNGDFKTAAKMVVEKLMDKFEAREQAPLTATDFKVGDRVELVERHSGADKGEKGTIIGFCPTGEDNITVEFDNYVSGHSGRLGCGEGKNGHCYHCRPSELKLTNGAVRTENSIDWEAFKHGEFVVHCDTEEKAKAFLKECDEHGIKWCTGEKASSSVCFHFYKGKTAYCCYFNPNKLEYCDTDWYREQGKAIIEYTPSKPTVKELEPEPYRIVKQDKYEVGDKVKIIDKWVDGCHENPEGEMDKWLGKIMTIREVNSDTYKTEEDKTEHLGSGWYWNNKCIEGKVVEDVPEKTAVKKVKRPAKVGEWIKLTSKSFDFNKVGDILPVCKSYDSHVCVYDKDQPKGRKEPDDDPFYEWAYGSDEYVVLENYQPEQSSLESKANYTTEIQIGDTVKVVNNGRCYTRYEEWFVKNAPQYLGKFAYGGMPKNGGSYKVLMKNDKDGLKYVIQEIDWPNDAVYLIDEKGIEKVK